MNEQIHITEEGKRRLAYELKHPNREAMARRDAFFASIKEEVHISQDPSVISVEMPGLSRDMLEEN